MLGSIKTFFERQLALDLPQNRQQSDHALKLATAALLLEVVMVDDHFDERERKVLDQALHEKFALTSAEIEEIIALAREETKEAADYYQFTSLINKHFSYEKRVRVVEMLWALVYADGHMDRYEEYTVRKIAELLYIGHSDFIAAKHKALGDA